MSVKTMSKEELEDKLTKVRDSALNGNPISIIATETDLEPKVIKSMIAAMRIRGLKLPKLRSMGVQGAIIEGWKKTNGDLFEDVSRPKKKKAA